MLKALFKKQFMELNAFLFYDAKRKTRRTGKGLVASLFLWAVLFLFVAVCMFIVSSLLATGLLPLGLTWVYFAVMGMVALFLGVFGGVFNTYQGLYRAKDNDLLLSLPIPPKAILAVKLTGVYAMGFLYESLVFVPAVIAYLVFGSPTFLSVVNCVLLSLLLGVAVLTLTCLFGFFLALVMGKLKNRSWLTVVLSLVFLGTYYYLCMNYVSMIENFIANAADVSEKLMRRVYPAYVFGEAAAGKALPMLYFTLGALLLFALTVFVTERTFLCLAVRNESPTGSRGKLSEKSGNVKKALLKKEWKRFSGSSVYMLNCGLGVFIAPLLAVLMIVFRGRILDAFSMISSLTGLGEGRMRALASLAVFLIATMLASIMDITAPSVSLEGESLWILQSLPVEPEKILSAKLRLHLLLAMPAVALFTTVAAILLRVGVLNGVFLTAASVLFTAFIAYLGLAANLRHPNVSWTNETVPVKQSFSVFLCIMGGWALSLALCGAGFVGVIFLPAAVAFSVICLLLLLGVILLRLFIMGKGCRIFQTL